MKSKVFCIGFHKTGTTTLEVALKKLGYEHQTIQKIVDFIGAKLAEWRGREGE